MTCRSLLASVIVVLTLGSAAAQLQAQVNDVLGPPTTIYGGGLRPFSTGDKARVEQLLRSFDPNSYDFHYQYLDAAGKAQHAHVGLASLTQSNTVRSAGSSASTVNTINIFRQASTVNTINIFKQGSLISESNVSFKDPKQNSAAQELNAILVRYGTPEPAKARSIETINASAASRVAQGSMKPLSAQDKARVEQLLRSFDPSSYDFHYEYLDASGSSQRAHVGMANLAQSNTARGVGSPNASTVNTINIFKQAGLTVTVNIFKPGTTQMNLFNVSLRDPHQQQAAQELNAILQRYVQ